MTTFYQHLHSWLESVHSIKFSWSVGLGGWAGGRIGGWWVGVHGIHLRQLKVLSLGSLAYHRVACASLA